MKRILFLLLLTVSVYGQNPSRFAKIQITGNTNSGTATKVNVQEANGEVNTQTINTGFNKNIGLGGSDVVGANTLLNQYGTTPIDWTATAFNSGQVVFYGGKQWIAKMATVAGDVPAVSSKWEEITFESLANKTITVDAIPTGGSNNAVSSNGVFDALATKAPISSVHNPVTLGTANGLSLSNQQLSLGLASSGVTGALSSTDWNTFNNKQDALGFTPENVANKHNSLAVDGTGTKYPTVDAVNEGLSNAITKEGNSQTKIGGFTSGGVNYAHKGDIWIAIGTSVTATGNWTNPMAKQLNLNLINFGVGGSTSNDLVNHYSDIPTLTSGNKDNYRLLTIEYSINDAGTGVSLATFRSNLENGILNAKGKGWANYKIMLVNGNYCTTVGLITALQPYAEEVIKIAKEQGVQYSDIYNYTKNNGGGLLLSDGIHPTADGGVVYARGVIASMYGGGEFSNSLTVVNKIKSGGIISDGDMSLNGLISGDVTKVLPAGNTFTTKTINLTRTNSTSLYVNRYITNYNEDGFASPASNENFTIRLNLNKSTNDASGIFSALNVNQNQNGSGSLGVQRVVYSNFLGTGSGAVASVSLFAGLAGNISPTFSIGTYKGLDLFQTYTSNVTKAYGVHVGDLFGSTLSRGIDLGVTSGAGKYNVYVSGAAPNYFSGSLLIGTTVSNGNSFRLTGTMELITPPTISAGGYDLLSRSLSTGVVERVPSTVFAPNILTGYVSGAGTVSATDTVLQAIQKLDGNDATKSNIGHTHVASQITDLSKASVGLGNVDNTSDLSKPLSTATINALATKFPTPTGLTTNYLPKWNGSGFGISQILDNGGNLLIGTTIDNGAAKLQVAGTISASPATTANQVPTWGQVQAITRPYKVYTALLTQTGTNAPVATVLENTLGGEVVWSRINNGTFDATLANAFVFNKTTVSVPSSINSFVHNSGRLNINVVRLITLNNSMANADNLLIGATIEIRVYN